MGTLRIVGLQFVIIHMFPLGKIIVGSRNFTIRSAEFTILSGEFTIEPGAFTSAQMYN